MHTADDMGLYVHEKRPEWGLAILSWKNDDRMCFQFQDGNARLFKSDYSDLLQPVDRPLDIRRQLLSELREKFAIAKAKRHRIQTMRAKGRKLLSFQEQLAVFQHLFPRGFTDPGYKTKFRGASASKRRKSHFDPLVREAAELLSHKRLNAHIDASAHAEMFQRSLALIKRSSLITQSRDHKPLTLLSLAEQREFVAGLFNLLYGARDLEVRFGEWLKLLKRLTGDAPSWPLATIYLGLRFPQKFTIVKQTVFREETKWSAPRLEFSQRPDARQYPRLCKMARAIRVRLVESELAPQDLLDIYQFIWQTRRPKAKQILKSAG